MDRYFLSIVQRLTLEELEMLNYLTKNEINNRFSAIKKKELQNITNFTEAIFRKIFTRLEALNLIEVVTGSKDHLVYVNEYGENAIQLIHERSNN